jgi:hypothetical protein
MPFVPEEHPKRQILVFAHAPPPHHGQSVMVELMLRGLEHDTALSVFHVDARVSHGLEDIGGFGAGKLGRLLSFCIQALGIRFRHGPMDLYYVPAPAKKSAIMRDWIVMSLLRPWFSRMILHWHAIGLGKWAAGDHAARASSSIVFPTLLDLPARFLTRLMLGEADLSLILTEADREEVSLLKPKRIEVIPNGIPDPCPFFESEGQPMRTTDTTQGTYRCLYLAHCTRDKGLFDAIEAIVLANELLARQGSTRRITLTITGSFMNEAEHRKFQTLMRGIPESVVRHVGFVSGAEKSALLRDHDCLVSFSKRETFGLNVVEALAFGMLPCLSPIPAYLANFSDVAVIAKEMNPSSYGTALIECALSPVRPKVLREFFLKSFTEEKFFGRIAEAFKKV